MISLYTTLNADRVEPTILEENAEIATLPLSEVAIGLDAYKDMLAGLQLKVVKENKVVREQPNQELPIYPEYKEACHEYKHIKCLIRT